MTEVEGEGFPARSFGVSEFQNADGPYLQPLYSGIERLRAHEHETANVQNLLLALGLCSVSMLYNQARSTPKNRMTAWN